MMEGRIECCANHSSSARRTVESALGSGSGAPSSERGKPRRYRRAWAGAANHVVPAALSEEVAQHLHGGSAGRGRTRSDF